MKIVYMDGTEYNLRDYGIRSLKESLSSPTYDFKLEQVGNRIIYLNSEFKDRTFEKGFFVEALDYVDMRLYLHEIYNIFRTDEPVYIVDAKVDVGIRRFVQIQSFKIDKLGTKMATFNVTFKQLNVYGESVITTKELMEFDVDKLQFAQGVQLDDFSYTHSTNTFNIYNAGDVVIDPRLCYLKITYKGSSTNLMIRNNTTSTEWTYVGTSTQSDTIVLEGVKSLKNGQSIFKNTNRRLITIAPGVNEFEVIGGNGTINFDFRFCYK